MAQLRQDYKELQSHQIEVLVVGPENASAFENYWRENELPYIGLPDPKSSVLKLYGQEVNLFKLGRMPAQVLVDKQGTARFVHYGKSMSDIPGPKEILSSLHGVNEEEKIRNDSPQ
ncbi:MAG: thioredoxin peroxidase [Chloroflexi bacterium]|nr:MAG: thioredoxin peroxidase [Chloroflexota bacterium]